MSQSTRILRNPETRQFYPKVLVALATAGVIGLSVLHTLPSTAATSERAPQHESFNAPATMHPGFSDMIEAVRPAVVNISTEMKAPDRLNTPNGMNPGTEEFMRKFFGTPQMPGRGAPRSRPKQATGSGFVVDPSGLVVTNRHVIEGADEITVILDDGTELTATVKGTDDKTDIALLAVETDVSLPWVAFDGSAETRVGDWIVAIGNPFGLGGTATTGIVSARGRDINSGPLDDYIQIDAPINSGNSGGPLFNEQGRVVGVNTAIYSPNGGSVGIGFAIPAHQAQQVVASLKEHGHVARGYLGVQIQEVNDEIATALGLNETAGALVVDVVPDSPASIAGIQSGDVITSFDGKAIDTMRDLPHVVAATDAEKEVTVEILRDRKSMELSVTPKVTGSKEVLALKDEQSGLSRGDDDTILGLAAATIDAEMRRNFGLSPDQVGVIIANVEQDGPSALQGLRPGDVITAIDQQPVTSVGELSEAVSRAVSDKQKAVLLKISRGGNSRFVAVPIA